MRSIFQRHTGAPTRCTVSGTHLWTNRLTRTFTRGAKQTKDISLTSTVSAAECQGSAHTVDDRQGRLFFSSEDTSAWNPGVLARASSTRVGASSKRHFPTDPQNSLFAVSLYTVSPSISVTPSNSEPGRSRHAGLDNPITSVRVRLHDCDSDQTLLSTLPPTPPQGFNSNQI